MKTPKFTIYILLNNIIDLIIYHISFKLTLKNTYIYYAEDIKF